MPVTNYIWDELSDNVLMETDENDALVANYTCEPSQFGEVLSQHRANNDQYFNFDGLGSTRDLTGNTQTVSDSYTYSAFGETVSSSGSTTNPFQWNGAVGYYTNEETGEFYVRRRSYDPAIARWLSRDPLGFVDGPNVYAYVGNQPINSLDPTGTLCVAGDCCCCAIDVKPKEIRPNVYWVQVNQLRGVRGIGARFIFEFVTEWDYKIIFPGKSNDENDCTMIWNERSTTGQSWPQDVWDVVIRDAKNIHGVDIKRKDQQKCKWYNQHKEHWYLGQFKPWRPVEKGGERKRECPGREVTPIEDIPGVWGPPGKTKIQFELILKSSPNCECDHAERKICFEFAAKIWKNGRIFVGIKPVECPFKKCPQLDWPF